ncbi:MAG TPA: alpha/beta hydrolase [Noviherbaspirillum sp.]|nr:alpha/beta hydrolase [Noviherbaspirillum sp.]
MKKLFLKSSVLMIGSALWLAGCGGGGGNDPAPQVSNGQTPGDTTAPVAETRPHDSRTFTAPDPTKQSDYELAADGSAGFRALPGSTVETDRWAGVLDGAGYRIEVPKNWNGKLVMYAHGYMGTDTQLKGAMPSIQRHLIENGYAWAISTYSKNYYDVQAGVEDTNKLARAFTTIAAQRGRVLAAPTKTYIIGHSMGGHVAGAAVEQETQNTAVNKQRYDGAVPMCGVMGDTELFDYLAAYQLAAQTLAGKSSHPFDRFEEIAPAVRSSLFTTFSTVPTSQGALLAQVVKNLTGGERPVFLHGFGNTSLQNVVWGMFGSDGTIDGILNKSTLDTNRFVYQFDDDPALSTEESTFNATVPKVTAAPDANTLRAGSLRWIPKLNGQFNVPVVTLHTLGDLYVPFSMQQIYRKRADAQGSGGWLVQRAIRAPSHCDFTVQEQIEAFDAMVTWAETGVKPAGDDVFTPSTVANPTYGCAFTRNTGTIGDSPVVLSIRELIAPQLAACPS